MVVLLGADEEEEGSEGSELSLGKPVRGGRRMSSFRFNALFSRVNAASCSSCDCNIGARSVKAHSSAWSESSFRGQTNGQP